MKFSIKDFFSKCDQIRRKLQIWSRLLKKSLTENVIFCAVYNSYSHLQKRIQNPVKYLRQSVLEKRIFSVYSSDILTSLKHPSHCICLKNVDRKVKVYDIYEGNMHINIIGNIPTNFPSILHRKKVQLKWLFRLDLMSMKMDESKRSSQEEDLGKGKFQILWESFFKLSP